MFVLNIIYCVHILNCSFFLCFKKYMEFFKSKRLFFFLFHNLIAYIYCIVKNIISLAGAYKKSLFFMTLITKIPKTEQQPVFLSVTFNEFILLTVAIISQH